MRGRLLSVLAVAVVLAVAAAAAFDSLRGDEPRVPAASPKPVRVTAAAVEPQDCVDGGPCLRSLREVVAFSRACVRSWNDSANRANQATVVEGDFDTATLFRSTRERCSLYLVSSAGARILLARRVQGRWWAVGGGRRPPAADDFHDPWTVAIRPDGTLSLRPD
jgi:hypothetical protein